MSKKNPPKSAKTGKQRTASGRNTRAAKPTPKKRAKSRAKPKSPRGAAKKAGPNGPLLAVTAERDQLRTALAEAESRLGELHQKAEGLEALQGKYEAAQRELAALRQRATEAEEVAEEAVETRASAPRSLDALPTTVALQPEDQADELRERLLHALNDAWAIEKEQAGLLQTLADESGDREIRALLEEHRAAAHRQLAELEARLEALGTRPAGGRGLLDQLVTRVWDAMQKPRDQADAAVQALVKAISAAECEAGAYAALHAFAGFCGDEQTAALAADSFAQERQRADRLREAIARAVERAARR